MSATIKITPSPGATEYRVTYGPTDPPAEGSTVIPAGSMIPMDDKLVADVPGIQPGHFVQVEAGNAYGYSAPIQGQALIAVALTSPEEAAVLKEEETVVIQGTSTGGLVDLEFTIDNEIWLPIAEDVDASTGTFSYEWTAVPLAIAIRAKTEGVADTVSVTTVPQSSPVITFVSVPDATVGQDYTVEVSITDADGDLIPPLAADATLNGVAADSVSNVGDVYSFTWLAASLPEVGTGYVLAVVADDEGNRHASESTMVDVVAEPASSLLDGLTHWWDLDEESGTRYDSHGTKHLTDRNTVGSVVVGSGRAASFVAANDEQLYADGINNPTTAVGLAMVVRFRLPESGGGGDLFKPNSIAWNSLTVDATGTVSFDSRHATYDWGVTLTAATTNGAWHTAVGMIAADGTAYLYVDGVLAGSVASRRNTSDVSDLKNRRLGIGNFENGFGSGGTPLQGDIDFVGYWHERALTEEEIIALESVNSYADLA